MITDKLLRLSENQVVTATAVSENTIDLRTARDIGEGENLYMVFTVTADFATLTDLTFSIVTDTAADLGTATILESTSAITLASNKLKAGCQHILRINPQVASLGKRYLGAKYTVGGSSATTGKITTDIVHDIQDGKKYYTSGFTVS